jgi:uncharacterized membrane protein YccC
MWGIATTWKLIRDWVRDHRTQLALCARVTVAAVLALALSQALNVPLVLWTVLTAVILTQTSVGKSLKAAIDYLVGTIGGAVYSGAIAVLVPHNTEVGLLLALAIAIAPLALLAGKNPSFNAAPVTAVLLLLSPTVLHVTPIESAIYRVLEVALGATTGVVVSYLLFPASAHVLAIDAGARMLDLMARALPDVFAGFTTELDPQINLRIQNSVGQALARLHAVGEEAKHERMTFLLTTAPDPAPLLRTLLRLRHDLVMIGRSAEIPLPDAFRERLGPLLAHVCEAMADHLRASSLALSARRPAPPRGALDAALDAYAAEMATLRRDGLTRGLPAEVVERIFSLSFVLEELRRHFIDLDRCVEECAQTRVGSMRGR